MENKIHNRKYALFPRGAEKKANQENPDQLIGTP